MKSYKLYSKLNIICNFQFLSLLLLLVTTTSVVVVQSQPCNHPVYCSGELLRMVQMAKIFNDSKTFVDMPLKYPPAQVLQSFQSLVNSSAPAGASPSPADIEQFVDSNFYPAGYEVVQVIPPDWSPTPAFINRITSPALQTFGQSVHSKWRDLSRTFNHTGLCDSCYSSISVPNPFIIAGSRFREYYYWDSFWMIQGLLVSEMTATARGMLLNFAAIFQQVGFIPNGGRLYYLNRSQPPLFTQMVQEYYLATSDADLVAQLLPILDQEYQFWMRHQTVEIESPNYSGVVYTLNLYNVSATQPRPESFAEDYSGAQYMSEQEAKAYYSGLATAAESGMDFSTKWFAPGSTNLSSIETNNVVSVDLNSILYANEETLAKFHQKFGGNQSMIEYYQQQASKRYSAMMDIMWNKADYQWYDYDLARGVQRQQYFITNYMPLWAGLQDAQPQYFNEDMIDSIVKGMYSVVMDYVGGVPTSMTDSGQQWDFPYAWSPLEYFIMESLFRTNSSIAIDMCNDLIQRWITTNYCGWQSTLSTDDGMMFEKYDVNEVGLPGGGGEYVVQEGFGWTNGVVLYLLNNFGNTLTLNPC